MLPSVLRNGFFKLKYGFRGIPRTIAGHPIRLDESLRRWNLEGEAAAAAVIQSCLHPGSVFVDIGANFGLHTIHAAKQVGEQGFVFAFEPVLRNLKLLQRNIALNHIQHQSFVVSAAVSNQSQPTLEFHIPTDEIAVTASLNPTANTQTVQVSNVRLEDYWQRIHLPIHLIKIDVEGAELEVLRGAETLLQRWHPQLLIEVHGFALPDFGASVEALQTFLSNLGYQENRLETDYFETDYFQALYTHPHQATQPLTSKIGITKMDQLTLAIDP